MPIYTAVVGYCITIVSAVVKNRHSENVVIDFLTFPKGKKEQDLFLSSKEEDEIWHIIHHDERMSSDKAKELLQ